MEVETANFWRRRRTASLSLPHRGNCNRNRKTFSSREKRPGRQAALARTMAALLQRGQIVRIITALPTIKRLATDAKVTAGMGPVAAATIEIHPSQPNPRLPAQLHSRPSQLARSGRFPFANLPFRHSIRVSLIILNESIEQRVGYCRESANTAPCRRVRHTTGKCAGGQTRLLIGETILASSRLRPYGKAGAP
jgi:hypothetical protein